jgi:hypothetical protein
LRRRPETASIVAQDRRLFQTVRCKFVGPRINEFGAQDQRNLHTAQREKNNGMRTLFFGGIRQAIGAAAAVFVIINGLIPTAVAAEAKRSATVYRVGFLWGLPPIAEWTAAFDQGLAELGWISGQNLVIEHRSADGHFDRLPALTAELVSL